MDINTDPCCGRTMDPARVQISAWIQKVAQATQFNMNPAAAWPSDINMSSGDSQDRHRHRLVCIWAMDPKHDSLLQHSLTHHLATDGMGHLYQPVLQYLCLYSAGTTPLLLLFHFYTTYLFIIVVHTPRDTVYLVRLSRK
ncbi:hypothetical protein STEG23_017080 [Scotinomys teguina]